MNENEETEAQRSHRVGIMRNLQLHSAMGMAMLLGYNSTYGHLGPSSRCEPEIPKRPCLNCSKEKQHNNAYCSGECCREHRAKKAQLFAMRYAGEVHIKTHDLVQPVKESKAPK